MKYKTPFALADAYKLSHWIQYPQDVRFVYSNLTPRRSLRIGIDHFVLFGLRPFLMKLEKTFNDRFFNIPEEEAINDFSTFYKDFFGSDPNLRVRAMIRELHNYGKLPLKITALNEGSVVKTGVPVLIIQNTDRMFPWMTNFIESWMSAELWQPCTSASTAMYYRMTFDKYAKETSDIEWLTPFQGHDFSFRGMPGLEAASASGAGHLLSFAGTDTLPALNWIHDHYSFTGDLLGTSVPATEHSVMCAGGEMNELETFERLLKLYPTGILSVVSDTWDFWGVVTNILPQIKDQIMARDGKLVIRPDSSPKTPVEIICGDPEATPGSPEHKGLVQCLYEIFGGTTNSKGYIQLDDHIGCIYGDAITLNTQTLILENLKRKGFASTNVVLGIGSFTYQHVTRDTYGIAIKATGIGKDGEEGTEWIPIFKDPKTDTSGKKSARGFLDVKKNFQGEYYQVENDSPRPSELLKVAFNEGLNEYYSKDYAEIRNNLRKHMEKLMPGFEGMLPFVQPITV